MIVKLEVRKGTTTAEKDAYYFIVFFLLLLLFFHFRSSLQSVPNTAGLLFA